MTRHNDTESGERLKLMELKQPDVDVPPHRTRVGLFDHTEPYGSRLPTPPGTPGPDTTGPDAPTPAAAPEPKKVFNPWKFGRTTLPPGLRRELMLAELPDSPEYVAPEAEDAAPQLELVATEQATADAKPEAPPITVRTKRARTRTRRRGALWLLAPLLALCFLGGGAVSVLTKRPSPSASTGDSTASRSRVAEPALPPRPTMIDLGSARPAPLQSNASEKNRAAPATEEAVKLPQRSTAPRIGATNGALAGQTSKTLKSAGNEAPSTKSPEDATEPPTIDAPKPAVDPAPPMSAAPTSAPPKRRNWAELK
ncbi:MAG: hypothetical protein ACOY0T_15875 [Myxococcota bacterium]